MIDIDIDGRGYTPQLQVNLLKQMVERQHVGWLLEGTDPSGCDKNSSTCVSLQIRLPLSAGVRRHACSEPNSELELLVNFGTPYVHYVASMSDSCAFDLADDGATWIEIRNLEVTTVVSSYALRVSGELGSESW